MKVMLCNDTASKAHMGCQAVSNAHARMLGRLGHRVSHRFFVNELSDGGHARFADIVAAVERDERFMAALDEVDAVAVNGEGTIHHGGGLALVAALKIAKRKGKATALVNCLFEDLRLDPAELGGFDHLSVRDPRSFAYARSLGLDCVQRFDSVVAADFSGPGVDLKGRIAVTDWTKTSDLVAGQASMRLITSQDASASAQLYPLHLASARTTWSGATATLATARAVVTSRHHGLYLAVLSGAPFVALQGYTWKGQGLLEALGGGFPHVATYRELLDALNGVSRLQARFAEARARLEDAAGLQHFDIFGRDEDSSGEAEEVERLSRQVAARPDLARRDVKHQKRRRIQERAWSRRFKPTLFQRLLGARAEASGP